MPRISIFARQMAGWLGIALLMAAASAAQPRTVRVEEPEEGAIHWLLMPTLNLDVIKAFTARVAASDRYTLSGSPAELVVVIVCVDPDKNKAVEGCTYKFEFRSKNAPEFNMPLGTPSPVVGSDAAKIADTIFEEFVTDTTEMKLSVAELEAKFRVASFCAKPENKVPCSGKLQ
jgi:hypothetical protein